MIIAPPARGASGWGRRACNGLVISLAVAALAVARGGPADAQHSGHAHGGETAAPARDARQRVVLARADRDRVLTEMRAMLESVSGALQGLAVSDLAAAERALVENGTHVLQTDDRLRKQLPKPFLELGDRLHTGLDELANRLRAGAPRDDALRMLGGVTSTCVACHATYRIDERR